MYTVAPLEKLTQIIAKLPGIGQRSARRLSLYLFDQENEYLNEFAKALVELHSNIQICKECYSLSEGEICNICSNDKRDKKIICVVELYTDALAIEKTEEYNGIYHVLGGLIEPIKGIGINDIRIKELINRINSKKIEEIILAFSASLESDTTASFIYKILKNNNYKGKVTRIAYGISLASNIENADSRSLARSLLDRIDMN